MRLFPERQVSHRCASPIGARLPCRDCGLSPIGAPILAAMTTIALSSCCDSERLAWMSQSTPALHLAGNVMIPIDLFHLDVPKALHMRVSLASLPGRLFELHQIDDVGAQLDRPLQRQLKYLLNQFLASSKDYEPTGHKCQRRVRIVDRVIKAYADPMIH